MRNINRSISLIVLLLLLSPLTRAQQMWGLVNSNFAGSNGALINPATLTTSKLYMDINLVTADIFADNNYLYVHAKDYSFFKFARKNPILPEYGPEKLAFDARPDKNLKNAFVQTLIKGPSFFQNRGRHGFAVYTGVRVLTSLSQVSYDLANFGYNGLSYEEQHNINYNNFDIYGNAIGMMEVGGSYAYALRRYGFDDLTVGITLKVLLGYSGGYLHAQNLDYIIVNDSTANIKNLNAELGYSLPFNYDNNEFPDGNGLIRGTGVGADIGVVYQRKVRTHQKRRYDKLCHQRYIDYHYRIGVSLLDFGYVRFNKNAQLHAYEDVDRYWVNIDTISYFNMNRLADELSTVFYGDPNASFRGNEFTMYLPAAVSIQADYHYWRNWYVNASFIHPLRLGNSTIVRPTQIAVTPRYETPQFEVAMPLSLYEWRYPRIGLALRYQFLTIGTDRLGAYTGLFDFTGIDLYISIKFNFSKGNCGLFRKFTPCQNNEYGILRKR